eukprot:TRINITY_DN2314_c0_g1_i3.p1 TRINITY_DN2314_c0_g1~~TRINITY_DN2314_c0_g1_i3.p1  ORF type:complete len:757 (+),score=113.95 TRINITY_DN2314_c0_g1_i3:76-2346(+)
MSNKYKVSVGCGGVWILIGLFFAIGGPLLDETVSNYGIEKALKDYLVVDSFDAPFYNDWAGGIEETNPYYEIYYMWNLTNAQDVGAGKDIPRYVQRGPYTYQRHRRNVNVSFLDDGNLARYSVLRDYIFMPDRSNGTIEDIIVNINPAYVGIMSQAGGLQAGITAAISPYLTRFITFFEKDFPRVYLAYLVPNTLQDVLVDGLIASIEDVLHDADASWDYFIKQWNEATSLPTTGNATLWRGFYGSALGLPLSAANSLWNQTITNSFLDSSANSTWNWGQMMNGNLDAGYLVDLFNITHDQARTVVSWYTNFTNELITPGVLSSNQINSTKALGYIQWGLASLLPAGVVDHYGTQLNLENPIELGLVSAVPDCSNMPADQVFSLFNIYRIQDPLVLQAYLLAASVNDSNGGAWGLSPHLSQCFYSYAVLVGAGFAEPDLEQIWQEEGNDMFATRTVDQWLWRCSDAWLDMVSPTSSCSLQFNHTYYAPHTVKTGKDDFSQIGLYVKWRNQSEIVGVWKNTLPVTGYTESGQFKPFLGNADVMTSFDPDMVRPTPMNHVYNVSINGINAYRYQINSALYAPNPLFYQTLTGTMNVTAVNQDVPILLSAWDLLHVPAYITDGMLAGMNATTEEECGTNIDIEPTTGMVVQAMKRLQVNLYFPPNNSWFDNQLYPTPVGYPNMKTGVIFPLVKVEEFVTLGDVTAGMIKGKLSQAANLPEQILLATVITGPILVIIGIFLIVFGYRGIRKTQAGYENIN